MKQTKSVGRLTNFERDSINKIHKDKEIFEKLNPTNRRLIYDFLLYISIGNLHHAKSKCYEIFCVEFPL